MSDDTRIICDHLDAFLDGDLPSGALEYFAAHLSSCPACREAVEEQAWIDALLQSDAASVLESPPVLQLRPKRRRWLVAAAAASVVAVAALLPLPRREGLGEGRPTSPQAFRSVPSRAAETNPDNPLPTRASDATSSTVATGGNPTPNPSLRGRGIEAEFVSHSDAIAVPLASEDPQVTVVKLLPTTTARRRAAWHQVIQSALHN
jgi:anti-sigma factor RsiW